MRKKAIFYLVPILIFLLGVNTVFSVSTKNKEVGSIFVTTTNIENSKKVVVIPKDKKVIFIKYDSKRKKIKVAYKGKEYWVLSKHLKNPTVIKPVPTTSEDFDNWSDIESSTSYYAKAAEAHKHFEASKTYKLVHEDVLSIIDGNKLVTKHKLKIGDSIIYKRPFESKNSETNPPQTVYTDVAIVEYKGKEFLMNVYSLLPEEKESLGGKLHKDLQRNLLPFESFVSVVDYTKVKTNSPIKGIRFHDRQYEVTRNLDVDFIFDIANGIDAFKKDKPTVYGIFHEFLKETFPTSWYEIEANLHTSKSSDTSFLSKKVQRDGIWISYYISPKFVTLNVYQYNANEKNK